MEWVAKFNLYDVTGRLGFRKELKMYFIENDFLPFQRTQLNLLMLTVVSWG